VPTRRLPGLVGGYTYASGDTSQGDGHKGTVGQLYSANYPKCGAADKFCWQNIHQLTLRVEYHAFSPRLARRRSLHQRWWHGLGLNPQSQCHQRQGRPRDRLPRHLQGEPSPAASRSKPATRTCSLGRTWCSPPRTFPCPRPTSCGNTGSEAHGPRYALTRRLRKRITNERMLRPVPQRISVPRSGVSSGFTGGSDPLEKTKLSRL